MLFVFDCYLLVKEKIKVETSQRAREKARKEAGLPYNAKFFVNAEDDEESANWQFKNEITVNRDFLQYVFILETTINISEDN